MHCQKAIGASTGGKLSRRRCTTCETHQSAASVSSVGARRLGLGAARPVDDGAAKGLSVGGRNPIGGLTLQASLLRLRGDAGSLTVSRVDVGRLGVRAAWPVHAGAPPKGCESAAAARSRAGLASRR